MAAPAPGTKIVYIKKKGKGHGGHHGGAWKVAYADFVTAMMALFILLWLLAQSDEQTKARLSEYFRTGEFPPAGQIVPLGDNSLLPEPEYSPRDATEELMTQAGGEMKSAIEEAAKEDPQLKELIKDVQVKMTPDGLLIEVTDSNDAMLFDVASAELKPALVKLLQTLGPILARLESPIEIHGHSDARPFPKGSKKTNWSLSFERGENARGVLAPLVREKQVSGVFVHADTDLADPDPMSAKNRRLQILAVKPTPKGDGGITAER